LIVQSVYGDDRHLDAGGLLDAAAIGFQLRARLLIKHVSEVANVALRFE
jgi:hypothetical protein